jgi:hypothetical protein
LHSCVGRDWQKVFICFFEKFPHVLWRSGFREVVWTREQLTSSQLIAGDRINKLSHLDGEKLSKLTFRIPGFYREGIVVQPNGSFVIAQAQERE